MLSVDCALYGIETRIQKEVSWNSSIDSTRLLIGLVSHDMMVQGNPGSVNAALQQIQARSQQTTDIKSEVNMGTAHRSLPMDSSIFGQGMMQSKPGIGSAGMTSWFLKEFKNQNRGIEFYVVYETGEGLKAS
ncbi:hypothetical protein ACE6H2_000050 [Prunus campanulata]